MDLRLAATYIPGLVCLVKTLGLILLMSRVWVMHSIPTMIFLGLLLYVDRVLRKESIFDASALTCTVFVAHLLNVCRSSIAHVDATAHHPHLPTVTVHPNQPHSPFYPAYY